MTGRIIALGRPKHFGRHVSSLRILRPVCGAMSGWVTAEVDKVSCLSCRKTKAYRKARKIDGRDPA